MDLIYIYTYFWLNSMASTSKLIGQIVKQEQNFCNTT
jgi:hypothetical protein